MSQIVDDLRQVAIEIKTETQVGGNTAARVGGAFERVADALEGTQQIEDMDAAVAAVQQAAAENEQTIQNIVNSLAVVQTTGQSTSDVMSQKAVTDRIESYKLIYNDELFSFSTTSKSKSKYYIREIPFVAGKTYRVTFTLDAAKSNMIELYLANQTTASSTLARILIGRMQAGETTKTIIYTCNDATMKYPSIYIASATSGSFVIVVEEIVSPNDAIEATNDRIDDVTIMELSLPTGITEFSGLGVSETTWITESPRTIQAIPLEGCDYVVLEAADDHNSGYAFLTSITHGVGLPVYYCRGFSGFIRLTAGTTETIALPPLAKYLIFNKSYSTSNFMPKSIKVHRKINIAEVSNAVIFANNLLFNQIDGDAYLSQNWVISSGGKWNETIGQTYSKFIQVKAGTYKMDAVNGILIYAVLNSINPVEGGTPDWANGYGQRYTIAYGGTTQITIPQDGLWLVVRADGGVIPNPDGARMPVISCLTENKIDYMQEEIDANKKPSNTIVIAASNSADVDKARADLICTGTDDNKVIESAFSLFASEVGTIYLCAGIYYVTSFTQDTDGTYVGIMIPSQGSNLKMVNFEGEQFAGAATKPAQFVVPQSVYDTLDGNANYSIFRHKFGTSGYNLGYSFTLRHLSIEIYSNQKKTIAIDCICSGQVTISDVRGTITTQPGVWGAGDSGLDPIPSLDCVFFKGLFGSAHANAKVDNASCTGYGIGFGIQGEHILCENCGAINCVYGFAFNYFPDLNHGSGVPGMYTHPMMIINPLEEGCLNFPYFGNNTLKQSIIITGYHNELRPKFFNQGGNYATEKVAGTWYGHVDYVIQFFPDSHSHGNEKHVVDKPFWANGSGINMESQNYAQKRLVTTTERLTYAPNYFQQVFDLTANKLLICTDPANKVWVDANGVQA